MLSVIVPVYNVEEFLNQCLDSIVDQSYTDMEIIIVNDGSTDRSPEICDDYAKRDSRIKVIHKANGGQSSARNIGIKAAVGDYIAYVDSDDIIHKDMFKKLIYICEKYDLDMIKCNMTRFKNADKPDDYSDDTGKLKMFSCEEALLNMLNAPYCRRKEFSVSVCNAVYKFEAIRDIFFPEGLLYEDGYYTPQAILSCEKLAHIDETLYFYRYNDNSTMSKGTTHKTLKSIDDWEYIHGCIKKKFPEHAHYAAERWINKLLVTYNQLIEDAELDCDGKYKAHIIDKINKNYSYFVSVTKNKDTLKALNILKNNPEKYPAYRKDGGRGIHKLASKIKSLIK